MSIPQALTLAFEHHQAGRLAEAEALYRQVLAAQPNHAGAWHFLGVLAGQAGRHDVAIELIRRSTVLQANDPLAHSNLGGAYRTMGRLAEAMAAYRRVIELGPDDPEAHNNLGVALADQGQGDEAMAAFRRAIQLNPGYPEAYYNLGQVLAKQGQFEEAISACHRAIELRPGYTEAHTILGVALIEQGRFDEAMVAFRRAIQVQPDYDRAVFNYSYLLLLRGDFEHGWPLFETRWGVLPSTKRNFSQPVWDGGVLDGRRILIHAEQGFGDSIHFIRYARLVSERGGEVVVECQPSLAELFRGVQGVKEVVAAGEALPPFDRHVAMLSQPLVLKTTRESIPREVPYLFTEPARVAIWRERLGGDRSRLRVGLAWAGDPGHPRDRIRSLPLRHLLPLIRMEGVDFFSVQKGRGAAEIQEIPEAARLIDHTGSFHDFAETAAFLTELDLIITVDTVVAHLAGALGRPVWTLLSFVPEWRWGLESEATPWYPTMRLFRQLALGDWDSVIQRVTQELDRMKVERASER